MPTKIHSRIINVYGYSSPTSSTLKKWVADFECRPESVVDDLRE